MKKISTVLIATIALAGCATAKKTFLPSGEEGYSINCSGTSLNWGMCYEKAGMLCGANGYEVIAGGADQGAVAGGAQGAFYASSVMNRSLLIKCK
jgi:hypothetical protein